MRVVSLQGYVFDVDQVASTRVEIASVVLTFRNGTQINLGWRDDLERTSVLKALELSNTGRQPVDCHV